MTAQNEDSSQQSFEPQKLYRSKIDRIFAGVCGGFAEYFNIDVVIVRVICLILFFFKGVGILLYLICLIVMKENPEQSGQPRKENQNTALYWGVGLIILGFSLLSSNWRWDFWPFHHWIWFDFWPFDWNRFWPLVIIVIGVLYLLYILQQNKAEKTTGESGAKLYRSRYEKIIGGVCGGIAKNLHIDPVIVRIGWVLLTLITKAILGVIVYVLWMIFIPEEPETLESQPQQETKAPVAPPKKTAKRVKKLPEKDKPEETN